MIADELATVTVVADDAIRTRILGSTAYWLINGPGVPPFVTIGTDARGGCFAFTVCASSETIGKENTRQIAKTKRAMQLTPNQLIVKESQHIVTHKQQ
ncbi:hypothetical protein [Poriferisphaera sp. WC338]|uniref:hypothetical protein n=1 Tax=Poriferisphaera sp. WC338 TaxID=3425129 RepID=UPI003D81BFA5